MVFCCMHLLLVEEMNNNFLSFPTWNNSSMSAKEVLCQIEADLA